MKGKLTHMMWCLYKRKQKINAGSEMALIAWVSEARSLERAAEEEGRSSVGWVCRAGVMLKSVSQYVSSPSQLLDKSGLRISDNYQFFGNTCLGVECPQMWGIATTVGKTVKSRRLKALHRLVIPTPQPLPPEPNNCTPGNCTLNTKLLSLQQCLCLVFVPWIR